MTAAQCPECGAEAGGCHCPLAPKVAAHTPGPWQYVKGGAFNPERWGAIVFEGEDGGEHIAEICAADGVTDEADAALIAAAPDLLAALREIADWPTAHEDRDTSNAMSRLARAALQKAAA